MSAIARTGPVLHSTHPWSGSGVRCDMVFAEHPVFQAPNDAEQPIWRYMDFAKLASMLSTSSLWFSRADLLGDPHEGSVGQATLDLRLEFERQMQEEHDAQPDASPIPAGTPPLSEQLTWATQYQLVRSCINCWYMDETESVAMWRGYAGLSTGVAVRSSYQALCDSITAERHVYVGVVNYIDPETDPIPLGNAMWPIMHKRSAFAYERELRAFASYPNAMIGEDKNLEPVAGLNIDVDLKTLVHEIVVGPDQSAWFVDAAASVVGALAPGVVVRKSRPRHGSTLLTWQSGGIDRPPDCSWAEE